MSGTLARIAPDTNWRYSPFRANQSLDQLEASFGAILRAGVLRKGKVTKSGANEVSLEANTLIWSKGVLWNIADNVVSAGPPPVLLGANPLPRTVAGAPSTNVYVYAQLVRTAVTDPIAYTALDSYAVVLSYSASAVPADDEHIPLCVVPLDGSGNIAGSIGDVMPEPAGPKYLHQWPNIGYRNVPVPGTGPYTLTDDDLAGGGKEFTGVLTGNRQVEIAPESGRFLPVLNSTTGAFSLTIRTPGTAGIVLARNTAALLWVTPAGVVVVATTDLLLAGAASSTRTLTAGTGLTGGGDLSADRTFDVAANADGSIVANANDIQVGVLATDAQHGNRGGGALHANVVAAGAAGFMTGADKTKLDGLNQSAASADAASAVGATYSQSEVQAILDELRDLKAKMRTAGLLHT